MPPEYVCVCVCVQVCVELNQKFGGALSPSCLENRYHPYIIHSRATPSFHPASSTHSWKHTPSPTWNWGGTQPQHSHPVVCWGLLEGIKMPCHTEAPTLSHRHLQPAGWHLITTASPWQRQQLHKDVFKQWRLHTLCARSVETVLPFINKRPVGVCVYVILFIPKYSFSLQSVEIFGKWDHFGLLSQLQLPVLSIGFHWGQSSYLE